MLTFKQYLKEENFKEQLFNEDKFDPFYIVWGFIDPEGKVLEKSGADAEVEGCHRKLAEKLGLGGIEEALKRGWVRWGLDTRRHMFFDYYLKNADPYVKNSILVLAEKYKKHWDTVGTNDRFNHRGKWLNTVEELKKEVMR
jgi:hypothetical protein